MLTTYSGVRDDIRCAERESRPQEAFKILLKHLLQKDDAGWTAGFIELLQNNGRWSDM